MLEVGAAAPAGVAVGEAGCSTRLHEELAEDSLPFGHVAGGSYVARDQSQRWRRRRRPLPLRGRHVWNRASQPDEHDAPPLTSLRVVRAVALDRPFTGRRERQAGPCARARAGRAEGRRSISERDPPRAASRARAQLRPRWGRRGASRCARRPVLRSNATTWACASATGPRPKATFSIVPHHPLKLTEDAHRIDLPARAVHRRSA
jgi:hypothetical protein